MVFVQAHPVKNQRSRKGHHPWHAYISCRTMRGFLRWAGSGGAPRPAPGRRRFPVESYEHIGAGRGSAPRRLRRLLKAARSTEYRASSTAISAVVLCTRTGSTGCSASSSDGGGRVMIFFIIVIVF